MKSSPQSGSRSAEGRSQGGNETRHADRSGSGAQRPFGFSIEQVSASEKINGYRDERRFNTVVADHVKHYQAVTGVGHKRQSYFVSPGHRGKLLRVCWRVLYREGWEVGILRAAVQNVK